MPKCSEQFDVLSNALRVLPEEAARLNYLFNEVNDPEEGISNIEIACVNVFNQIYGMMLTLKDEGYISSIYDDDAINTTLCIRHVLQHQAGRIKNYLRDAFNNTLSDNAVLVNYSVSGEPMTEFPFYINMHWIIDEVGKSNNAKKLPGIRSKWCFDQIAADMEKEHINSSEIYINIMAFITESVRQIRKKYGNNFQPFGFDSRVYYNHFNSIEEVDSQNYIIARYE